MSISVSITDGPLAPILPAARAEGGGGVLIFEGVVRPTEDGRAIAGLDYESYEPMAQKVITAIATELVARHGLLAMRIEHSRGRVPIGECSFRLTIHSRHRKESLAAADEFIDRLKQDVPIWKHAVPV